MNNIQNASKWDIYFANPEKDQDLIIRARKFFYGKPDDEKRVEWLYYNNPAGPLYVAFALDGHTIAGQYIVIPANLIIDGRQVKGSISLDTFTNPNYRYQGIFTKLAETVYSKLSDNHVVLTLGLPNNNSRPGFLNKLNFVEPYPAFRMIRLLSPIPKDFPIAGRVLAKIPLGFMNNAAGKFKALQLEITDSPDKDQLDYLWKLISTQLNYGLVKDSTWTCWRYMDNPSFSYEFLTAKKNGVLIGYIVWNKTKILQDNNGYKSIVLMDIVTHDFWVAVSLIQAFMDEISKKVHYIKAASVLWSKEFYTLLISGFIPVKSQSLILRIHDEELSHANTLRNKMWPHGYYLADNI